MKDFVVMGGKFNEKTNEAVVNQVNVTKKHVNMLCDAFTTDFNIVKLALQDCLFYESDLDTLLDIIMNHSSIHCLIMIAVRVWKIHSRCSFDFC